MKSLDIVIANANFKLTVVEHDGIRWVPIRPICEAIGIDPSKQRKRVMNDPKFRGYQLASPSNGGVQETVHIPLQQLEGFLFTINVRASMNPEVAHRLLEFQKGISLLIHNAFNDVVTNTELNKAMYEIIMSLQKTVQVLEQKLESQNALITHLMQENTLNRQYVDDKLMSIGGSLMSNGYQKKRKLIQVA